MNYGESLKGPIVLFGALVGYLPKTPRETKHELVKLEENYYGGFSLVKLYSRWELGREDILITDVEELENLASLKYISKY